MVKEYKMSWEEFDGRCKLLAKRVKKFKDIKSIFGIPRGGLIPAVRLSHLTGLPLTGNPDPITTLIVDDIIDSGKTRESFSNFKHFDVVINKQTEVISEWVIFPWEVK